MVSLGIREPHTYTDVVCRGKQSLVNARFVALKEHLNNMSEVTKTVGLRLPEDVIQAIDEIAESDETFRSDVLRTLIVTHPRFATQAEGAVA